MTDLEIVYAFNRHKPQLLKYVFKNNELKYGITRIDLECIVDELPLKVIKSKAKFTNEPQLEEYLYRAIDNNVREFYGAKRIQDIPKMSDNDRMENYILAKDIINKNRKAGKEVIYSRIQTQTETETNIEDIIHRCLYKIHQTETNYNPITETMAKQDFCFTYYDGDAARDKSHMNRLERGAYDDIISAQRKKGRLLIDDIKKVLGSDFDSCWSSMEWVLKKDDEKKYYIEWVEVSVDKMKKNSEKQKEKIQNYWDKKKIETDTTEIPQYNHGINSEEPLEDGNGNGYIEEELKGGTGGKEIIPQMLKAWRSKNKNYPLDKQKDSPALLKIAQFICDQENVRLNTTSSDCVTTIMHAWEHLCEHIPKDKFYKNHSLEQVAKYMQSIVLTIQNGSNNTSGKQNSHLTSESLNEAHAKYFG